MRNVFDSKLELLDAEILVMSSSMEEAILGAINVLETRNVQEAHRIIESDDDIDAQELEIENLCIKLLLTQQPVATDLRRVSAALKMVGDMERIGDHAADIAEIILDLKGDFDVRLMKHLSAMGHHACNMVHDAVEAYIDRDINKAREIFEKDKFLNETFDDVKKDIAYSIQERQDLAGDLVDALMIAKYLERVGDHVKNIGEWVEYSLTGNFKGEPIG